MSEHDPEAVPEGSAELPRIDPPLIEHRPEPEAAMAPAAVVRRRGGTPLPLTLLLTAALGGGIYWTWTHPNGAPFASAQGGDVQPAIEAARGQLAGQIQAVTQQVSALSARVDTLEKQPAPPAQPAPQAQPGPQAEPAPNGEAVADLAKRLDEVGAHVDALAAKQDAQAAAIQKSAELAAQQPAPSPSPPPADNTAAQVPALIAGQQAADTGRRLDQSLAAQKAASDQAIAEQKTATDQALAAQKSTLDALEQRLAKLEQGSGTVAAQSQAQDQAAQQSAGETKTCLAAIDQRVAKLEQESGQVQGVAKDANRAIRLEAAQAALESGQPVGDLPGAPPALARFATTAPPTESGLREAFPRVADAARAASQPDLSQRSFLDRAFARVQQSVTVRRGDHVLVGDPASGLLARAQTQVNAGNLKGAADTLGALNGPAAAAAKDWVAQVRALLDARAALASMAHS